GMEQRQRAVVERRLDELAAPGMRALLQRQQDAERGAEAGGDVDHRHADAQRIAARLAIEAHQPGHGLYRRVIAGISAERSIGAEARDAAMDEAREFVL